MEFNQYMEMPFASLFHTVFTEQGTVKACGREACRALIARAGEACGDIKTGRLKLPEAYQAARKLVPLQ